MAGERDHGDYVPANVLIANRRITALLDLRTVRNSHPLIDAAWWGLIVRHHHQRHYERAFSSFLSAAGLADDAAARSGLPHPALVRLVHVAADKGWSVSDLGEGLLATALDWTRSEDC